MSSPGPKRVPEADSSVLPEPTGASASATASVVSTINKDEIEPQELLLLREFFLLLDQWDRQQER
jgi:hypothetical protein